MSQEESHPGRTTDPAEKSGPLGIFKVCIVLPLPLVKANRKQANRSAIQVNRSVFRLTGVLFILNYENVLAAGHLVYFKSRSTAGHLDVINIFSLI